jgi:arylsulfatase A-like enzyme
MPNVSAAGGPPAERRLSARSPLDALLVACCFGLAGGFLELCAQLLAKHVLHTTEYHKQGRFFPWALPVANLAIMVVPGLIVALLERLRPGLVPFRVATWMFATLMLWAPLLILPVTGWTGLLLAAGLGRLISRPVASLASFSPRTVRVSLAGMAGLLVVVAAASAGREAIAEYWTTAHLPEPPSGVPNVLLLVLDTVRAESLSLHGYQRDTTPQLARWARRGVKFDWAIAPSCWTFPSHCTFFTGQWPFQLSSHWNHVLDTPNPTLAEFLRARGYLTAGFAANTHYISYESGVNRGFVHYEDFVLSPRTILDTAALGHWIAERTLPSADYYHRKWDMYRSRDARKINGAFLDWLSQNRGAKRPFFAFLNYLDAHGPYLVPESQAVRFGLRPESRREYEMMLDSWGIDKTRLSGRDVGLLHDGYDDCIAFLDHQIGALLDELERRDSLRNTVVIITSDHGEEFGEHKIFGHGFSLYLYESHVPLVIIAPSVPAGRTITDPVSLRDLPVSIVDLLGLADRATFPGRPFADHWRTGSDTVAFPATPALSEAFFPNFAPDNQGAIGPTQRGYTMSLVTRGWHYLRDGTGAEALFDLKDDPGESLNQLRILPDAPARLSGYRQSILQALNDKPKTPATERIDVSKFRKSLERLVQSYSLTDRSEPVPSSARGMR